MIEIEVDLKFFKLRAKGHSGKAGSSIVCAGVSALFYTLARSVQLHDYMFGDIKICDDADAEWKTIDCKVRSSYGEQALCILYTIAIGLEEIAKAYPEEVKMTAI